MSNCFTGPFITASSNQQGRAESSGKLYCIPVYVILNLSLVFSTILSPFLPSIIISSKFNVKTLEALVERDVGLATILGIINQYGGRSYLRLNEHPESNINQ